MHGSVSKDMIDVDGVCRSRLNSDGQPIHSTEEGIINFWRWFGDSMTVDRLGRPVIYCHGTDARFEEFETHSELGAHFGTVKQADSIKSNRVGTHAISAYIRLHNPIRLQDDGDFMSNGIVGQLESLNLIDHALAETMYESEDQKDTDTLKQILINYGFDGVVYLNRREGLSCQDVPGHLQTSEMTDSEFSRHVPMAEDSYIAFFPNQIKSAVGNNGDFNPASCNIYDAEKSVEHLFDDGEAEMHFNGAF